MTWQDFPNLLKTLEFGDSPAGGSLVIYHNNQKVVDTSFGQALADKAWNSHTLSVNFSIGKGIMATLIAILVSKKQLNYHTPICQIWSNFAKYGKEHISLKHILTHTAGLFDISSIKSDVDELLDWQLMSDKVAHMVPSAPQGQQKHHYASAYSALVSGWILGNVVERVTGLSLQQALDEYLAKPLGIEGELFYGLPKEKLGQVAKPVRYFYENPTHRKKPLLKPDTPEILHRLSNYAITPLWQEVLQDTPITTANINKLYFDTTRMNLANYKNALMPNGKDGLEYHRDDVLQAVIPAANGVSTANALAKVYAMHANDGVWQDVEYIDTKTLHEMREIRVDGFDAVMPADMCWRMGFHRLFSLQYTPLAYGHMGYNGSVAFADPQRKLSFAFIHNFDTTMLNDVRQFVLTETAIAQVDRLLE